MGGRDPRSFDDPVPGADPERTRCAAPRTAPRAAPRTAATTLTTLITLAPLTMPLPLESSTPSASAAIRCTPPQAKGKAKAEAKEEPKARRARAPPAGGASTAASKMLVGGPLRFKVGGEPGPSRRECGT